MTAHPSRHLPGVRFETQPPPLTEVLPRMDVAAFVGFAASGPLHKPVVVEDIEHYTAIFGEDVPLAWDQQQNELVYAYLAPTVRAFFRNGGKRCWVVRVASEQAQYNYFPIPGLAQVDAEGEVVPTFARSRSQGNWSDDVQVSTTLLSFPLTVAGVVSLGTGKTSAEVQLALNSPHDVAVGDLLRLTFSGDTGDTYEWLLAVKMVKSLEQDESTNHGTPQISRTTGQGIVKVAGSTICWFTPVPTHSPPVPPVHATYFTYQETNGVVARTIVVHSYEIEEVDQTITLTLDTSLAAAPEPGTFVRLDFETEHAFILVQSVDTSSNYGSPPIEVVVVKGQARKVLTETPPISPSSYKSMRAEKLTFELWTRQEHGDVLHLSDLAFQPGHPRFWGVLPTDEQLYDVTAMPSSTTPVNLWQATPPDLAYTDLWQMANSPRFPLAGLPGSSAYYVPIVMPPLPALFVGSVLPTDQQMRDPLMRNGLSDFQEELFLDPTLCTAYTTELMARADYLRYQVFDPQSTRSSRSIQITPTSGDAPPVYTPPALKGVYALFDIEEITLIAVPDAVHRGWTVSSVQEEKNFSEVLQVEQFDLATATKPFASTSPASTFSPCHTNTIEAPHLDTPVSFSTQGEFTLLWSINSSTEKTANIYYELEEAIWPDFRESNIIYKGENKHFTLYGRNPGIYYYHVRVRVEDLISDWSTVLLIHIAPPMRQQLTAADKYASDVLLAVHRALLRLCAARGDLCAIFTLPEHFRSDEVVAHARRLKAPFDLLSNASVIRVGEGVPPLTPGETLAFSYGALYHPWLFTSEETQSDVTKRMPPDGSVCGMIAQRAISRGAWVAPANVPLSGVITLTPRIAKSSWLRLLETHANLIQQEPRGFLTLSADTLSDDEDLQPLNVRRLLILLRRLALRLGSSYVFEPNDDSFRRLVQRAFEEALEDLFVRGAFVGRTPASAFQVVLIEEANTPQSADEGKLIVELRVAPSLPLTFLTVRLILQSDGLGAITEGG